jgi:hypothetical protein
VNFVCRRSLRRLQHRCHRVEANPLLSGEGRWKSYLGSSNVHVKGPHIPSSGQIGPRQGGGSPNLVCFLLAMWLEDVHVMEFLRTHALE